MNEERFVVNIGLYYKSVCDNYTSFFRVVKALGGSVLISSFTIAAF